MVSQRVCCHCRSVVTTSRRPVGSLFDPARTAADQRLSFWRSPLSENQQDRHRRRRRSQSPRHRGPVSRRGSVISPILGDQLVPSSCSHASSASRFWMRAPLKCPHPSPRLLRIFRQARTSPRSHHHRWLGHNRRRRPVESKPLLPFPLQSPGRMRHISYPRCCPPPHTISRIGTRSFLPQ